MSDYKIQELPEGFFFCCVISLLFPHHTDVMVRDAYLNRSKLYTKDKDELIKLIPEMLNLIGIFDKYKHWFILRYK